MKIAGLSMSTPWASRSRWGAMTLFDDSKVLEFNAVPSELIISMDSVYITHDLENTQYRPKLRFRGHLDKVVPSVKLPDGIEEVYFNGESKPLIEGYYDFSDSQLARLVAQKGYFTSTFSTPKTFVDYAWSIPMTFDALYVKGQGDIAPAIFVDIKDALNLSIDEASSGYDFVEQFDDISTFIKKPEHENILNADIEHDDLFDNIEYKNIPNMEQNIENEVKSDKYRSTIFEDLLSKSKGGDLLNETVVTQEDLEPVSFVDDKEEESFDVDEIFEKVKDNIDIDNISRENIVTIGQKNTSDEGKIQEVKTKLQNKQVQDISKSDASKRLAASVENMENIEEDMDLDI